MNGVTRPSTSTMLTSVPSRQMYELLSMNGRVVASGRVLSDCEEVPNNVYKIIVDDIVDWTAELFGVHGQTFGDIEIGHTIQWLKFLTRPT